MVIAPPPAKRSRPTLQWPAIFLATLISFAGHAAERLSGVSRTIDGDTLEIGSVKVRLASIDAPESDQLCLDAHGQPWTCGIEAGEQLSAHIGNRSVECMSTGSDAYGRTLAVCTVAGENLNRWLVQQGWALAFVRYSTEYVRDEEIARAARRGLWSGAFIAPWDWRHRNARTVVLGATVVPISAQAQLLAPASAAAAPSPDCLIKGNVNRKGERIYFVPANSITRGSI
jgi:endonuclease YncB( thermonuclease family)